MAPAGELRPWSEPTLAYFPNARCGSGWDLSLTRPCVCHVCHSTSVRG